MVNSIKKNPYQREEGVLVSVCVGYSFVEDCHSTWTTVSAFLR